MPFPIYSIGASKRRVRFIEEAGGAVNPLVSFAWTNTIPTHQAGDIIISFMDVSGAPAPSITTPTGWTLLDTGSYSQAPLSKNASLIAKKATSNSETADSGWTAKFWGVYRGFSNFGVGIIGTGAGSTLTWATIPITSGSWVAGSGYGTTINPPSGTVTRDDSISAYRYLVWDTGAPVTSWSTVTAGSACQVVSVFELIL